MLYYNSEKFIKSTDYIINNFYESPFEFFEEISVYLREKNFYGLGHKVNVYFEMLHEFYKDKDFKNKDIFLEYIKFDYLYMEKPKFDFSWLKRESDKDKYNEILKSRVKFNIRELYKATEYEVFNIDIFTGEKKKQEILFHYNKEKSVEVIS